LDYHIFDLFRSVTICDFIKDPHFSFVLFEGEGLFLNVEALVDTSLAEDVLLDGPVDHESVQS